MELQVQKFLRNGGTIEQLKELYSIDARWHPEYVNLVLLKYNQIESPFKEEIVKECRGIVLDSADNWRVVCWSFKKFHNFGEPLADNIDWSTAEVQEKCDGSLIQLFWYNNRWNVATSGTPDAGGLVGDYGETFAELFWKVAEEQGIEFDALSTNHCWSFELCTALNRVVVNHEQSKIYVIGCRNLESLEERKLNNKDIRLSGLLSPRKFPLRCVDDCIEVAAVLDPLKQEGFVVVDGNFNRIKIKSPAYIMLHHTKDTLSIRKMVDIVRFGEYEEFSIAIRSIPELAKLFDKVKTFYDGYVSSADDNYSRIKHIKDQKEFAKWAKGADNGIFASVLFAMRKNKQTAKQVLSNKFIHTETVIKMLELK
jgi:RNA ligase